MKLEALIALGFNGPAEERDGVLIFQDDTPRPSNEEIEAKATELQAEFEATQYRRDRKYPPIGDQLDMIYWDQVNGTTMWHDTISGVKSAFPKGE